MKNKSCYFLGHRDSPESIMPLLFKVIEKHITEYGVTTFYAGHYGAFDGMAANALSEIKKRCPHIKAYLLLAYHPAIRHFDVPEGLDGSILLDGQENSPPRYAIINLNKRIIREVDYLIAYSKYITDGSHNLLNYAMAREKKGQLVITNLADVPSEI
jgi:hypothetical protein